MADDRNEIRHVNWAEVFGFTQIFKGFRLAIHPSKLALAFAAIALTWLAAHGLQLAWKLSTTHGYVAPGEIQAYVRSESSAAFDEGRKGWLEARPDMAARLKQSAQPSFASEVMRAINRASDGHFQKAFAKLVEDKKFEPGTRDASVSKDVKKTLGDAQREIDLANEKLADVIAKAYTQAKEQIKDGKGFPENKDLSESEKKAKALKQLEKDHASAIHALAKQRAEMEANLDSVRGRGIATAFVEYEWDQVYNAIVAVTNGNIFTGLPIAGQAPAAGPRGFLAYLIDAMRGVAWLLSQHIVFGLILLAVLLAIWSLLGGAIHRIAALHVARDEKISIVQSLRFAFSKWPSFFTAPLIPIAVIFIFGALIMLGGVAGNLWGFGAILMGVLLVLAILMGLVIAFIAVGLVTGCGLMYPTIAVEGSDSFDAISRSFAYVYAKPWHAALYALVALVYGVACYLFVRLFAWIALASTQGFLRWGCWQGGEAIGESDKVAAMWPAPTFSQLLPDIQWAYLSGWESVGAVAIWVWVAVVVAFANAFLLSYASSANTIIYLLLRRRVDATDMDDVYVQEQPDQPLAEQPAPATPAATESTIAAEKSEDVEKKE